VLLAAQSEAHHVAPRLLANSDDLERLAAGEDDIPALHGWRREVFGETALLGIPARTASVRAETELACLCFAAADFDRLTADYPQIKIAVLNNLATELASKLSQSNQLIRALAG
jgi:hypothetical protein